MNTPEGVATAREIQDRTYNVAVVDDDHDDFVLLSNLLEFSDRGTFRLTHIASFDEAVRRIESEVYDVALIDNKLGRDSGIDLINRLGGRIAPCALIMLTGGGFDELDLAALEVGAADYLDKNDLSTQMLSRALIYAHSRFDIHRQLRRSQAESRAARAAAEAANAAKSEFLARMSHQLRTPLNSIIGFAEIIGGRGLGETAWEKYVEFARDIETSGVLLLDMINDVLDIARIEAGDYALKPEPLDLTPVIAETTGRFEDVCARRGVALALEGAGGSMDAYADPHAVRQILKNLISNAVKFTPADGRIRVSAQQSPEEVEVAVADTGIGIAETDLSKVLIPFEHIKQSYVSPELGSGLGLAISRSLAELQGGSLRIESTEGAGTTVFVCLPRRAAA